MPFIRGQLLPPLLVALRLPDAAVLQRTTLETLAAHATEAGPLLSEHVASLVPACLALATSGTPDGARAPSSVRVAALGLLGLLAALPYAAVHPFRGKVIADVAAALDDPRRPVRVAAAAARSRWYLLGSPA